MKRVNITKKQRGFTIIELMIATTIFSLVLMICLAAIMTITRMYYQGTLQARTQNKVREIVDEVADEIRYRPGKVEITSGPRVLTDAPELADGLVGSVTPDTPEDYYGQYCVGSIRYRYLLGYKTDQNAQVASGDTDDRVASRPLSRENLPGGCGDSYEIDEHDDIVDELVLSDQANNMLDENMRLLEFDITKIGDLEKYRVAVTIAYGDDDMIGFENGNFICRPDNVARAYCATSRLEVIVGKRF